MQIKAEDPICIITSSHKDGLLSGLLPPVTLCLKTGQKLGATIGRGVIFFLSQTFLSSLVLTQGVGFQLNRTVN